MGDRIALRNTRPRIGSARQHRAVGFPPPRTRPVAPATRGGRGAHDAHMELVSTAPGTALLLAALGAVAVAGCTIDIGDDAQRRAETDLVPAAGITALAVSTDNGGVEVVADDVDEIEIRSLIREDDEGDARVTIGRREHRLDVTGRCDTDWWDDCAIGFRIVVPDAVAVDVTSDHGAIGLHGLTGRVEASTANGAVDGTDLRAGEVRVRTDRGRIVLDFGRAPTLVDARTDNGAVVVQLPDDGESYSVDAASDNGAIAVDVADDPGADRRVVARSDNGAIAVTRRSPTP